MDDAAIRFVPRLADLKPAEKLLTFPFYGKGGVRRLSAVGHANGLAQLQVGGKMMIVSYMLLKIMVNTAHLTVMPRIHPIQRMR